MLKVTPVFTLRSDLQTDVVAVQKFSSCCVKFTPNLIVVVEETQDSGSMAKPPHDKANELVPGGMPRSPQHLDLLLLVVGGVWRMELDSE